MLRFKESLETLQEIVARCEIPGRWQLHAKSNYHRFLADTGAILNWWLTTKAMNFQGNDAGHFKDLFLWHTLVYVEKPVPALSRDEAVWVDLAVLSPPSAGSRSERKSSRKEKHRKVHCFILTSAPSSCAFCRVCTSDTPAK
jgi:hypothetical protein